MTDRRSARAVLRATTQDLHDRVDRAFAGFSLGERAGYAAFLDAQARAFLPTEAALDAAGIADVVVDWPCRRRGAALRADLAELDQAPPPAAGPIAFAGTAAALGGAYVLEGSRLGGAFLARALPADAPRRFLAPVDGQRWRGLLATLDEMLEDDADIGAAVDSASAVFRLFEAGANQGAPS